MDCKIDLVQLMSEEGLPLYVYADGTVTHKMVPGKIKIGKIWGCLDGVEPKEKLPCKEQFFSKPFTEEDARKQEEEEQQQTKPQQLQEQETVQVEKSATEVKTFFPEVKVGWYWSSSEYSYSDAWDVLADNGAVDYSCKYHLYHYVRCVLAF